MGDTGLILYNSSGHEVATIEAYVDERERSEFPWISEVAGLPTAQQRLVQLSQLSLNFPSTNTQTDLCSIHTGGKYRLPLARRKSSLDAHTSALGTAKFVVYQRSRWQGIILTTGSKRFAEGEDRFR